MRKNQSIEVFIQNPELRERTASDMDEDRAANSKLPLVTQLAHLFEGSEMPTAASLKFIIAEYSDHLIEHVVSTTINQMGQNPFYVYPMAGHSTYFAQRLSVVNTADFDLNLDFIDPVLLKKYKTESKQNLQQRGVSFFGRETLSYFVHAGNMTISHWSHPTCTTQLAGMRCTPAGTQQVADRHFVHCHNNQTYMYESCEQSAVVVSLEIKRGKLPVSLIFSAADHTLRFQNPSDETDSRLQLCMAILAKLDYVDAIPTLKTFLKHSHHFIRWYAMQQILALDALEVLQELADMAVTDPHPEVKLAAKQTLLMIQQQEFEHAC
ncbi:HEAT repeat domain-containing protein [Salinimonas marina]|uniref:HEAT repeat domain-containing protein n=1 Tax=Salinimonas marina TaxID=2785918 RepID=A0A7S9HD28_9ALTE|nr:HEAT repeat domain-containing protein [Salinimonas marina]QPG05750.1 HEAT repeat domain-containing protein [Salinimonas marina]